MFLFFTGHTRGSPSQMIQRLNEEVQIHKITTKQRDINIHDAGPDNSAKTS